MAGFHYEIYRPAATQPDWSTSLSCGLSGFIGRFILLGNFCMIYRPIPSLDYGDNLHFVTEYVLLVLIY